MHLAQPVAEGAHGDAGQRVLCLLRIPLHLHEDKHFRFVTLRLQLEIGELEHLMTLSTCPMHPARSTSMPTASDVQLRSM